MNNQKQIKTDKTENNQCEYYKTVGGKYYTYFALHKLKILFFFTEFLQRIIQSNESF